MFLCYFVVVSILVAIIYHIELPPTEMGKKVTGKPKIELVK